MKIKKKMWYSLLSVLWIFILVFPVMASEIPEERQKPLLVDEQPKRMRMTIMITMDMDMEKMTMAFFF